MGPSERGALTLRPGRVARTARAAHVNVFACNARAVHVNVLIAVA